MDRANDATSKERRQSRASNWGAGNMHLCLPRPSGSIFWTRQLLINYNSNNIVRGLIKWVIICCCVMAVKRRLLPHGFIFNTFRETPCSILNLTVKNELNKSRSKYLEDSRVHRKNVKRVIKASCLSSSLSLPIVKLLWTQPNYMPVFFAFPVLHLHS